MKKIRTTNPLFIIFLLPIIVDVVGTVTGQRTEYWNSNFQSIDEAAPVFFLLQMHPLLFIIVCLAIWLPFTNWLTKKLKEPYNLWATMALFAGHAYNSVNWLRVTQRNWGIWAGPDRVSITLSLIPMALYILLIGYIAAKGIKQYLDSRD